MVAALFVFMTAIWAVTTRGNFWPAWALLGLGSAVGAHDLLVRDQRRDRSPAGSRRSRRPGLARSRSRTPSCGGSSATSTTAPRRGWSRSGSASGWLSRSSRSDPAGAEQLVAEARAGVAEAIRELRDLSRGIYPPVLTDRGIGAALATLADRSPLPTPSPWTSTSGRRAAVETAAYFVAAEALANAAKHSGAGRIEISVAAGTDASRSRHGRRPGRRRPLRAGLSASAGGSRRSTARWRSKAPRGTDHDPSGAPVRVVIAEDLALLRDGLARLLRDNGFEVVADVDNADSLVHAVVAEAPDLAIVDIRLPRPSGTRVCGRR